MEKRKENVMEPPSQTPRPTPEEIENQHRFNELRGELLNVREKTVQRWLTAVAAIVTFFSIVGLGGGYMNLAEIRHKKNEAEELLKQIKKTKDDTDNLNAKGANVKDTQPPSKPSKSLQGKFGEKWQKLKPNLVYRATSDGFIAAYTGGKNPAHQFAVYTGKEQDSLAWRTRAGRYDGTVCPVPEGHFWTVRALDTDGSPVQGEVTVQWLPVISSDTDKTASDTELTQ